MQLTFGMFDHIDLGHRTVQQVYEHRFRMAERIDQAGFYAFHVAEHHGTTLSCSPSPNLFLAAVSQRTKRLKLAPLVYILPMYNPQRLIEEICMLDHMSGGRLEMGVGKGIAPFEHTIWGINPLEALDRYKEVLEIVLLGLTQPKLTYKGDYHRYIDVPMVMRPLQQPHPPLWYGVWLDPKATIWPAQMGCNIATIISAKGVRPLTDRFREEWVKAQGAKPLPHMSLNRTVIIGKTDAEARAIAERAHKNYQHSLGYLWHIFGATPAHFPTDFEEVLEKEMIICGSASKVRDEVAKQCEVSGTNYLLARFAYGDMTDAEVEYSLDQFIEKVMPAFNTPEKQPAIA